MKDHGTLTIGIIWSNSVLMGDQLNSNPSPSVVFPDLGNEIGVEEIVGI